MALARGEHAARRRRDEWIEAGPMERLGGISLETYERLIGLEPADLAVDGCITNAPRGGEKAGRSPADRGKGGVERSTVAEARGIPLGSAIAPADRHDSPLLEATLDASEPLLGELCRIERACIWTAPTTLGHHSPRGGGSLLLVGEISEKGKPAPLKAGKRRRRVVERTNSWHNDAHKEPAWCTERCGDGSHRFLGGLLGGRGHNRQATHPRRPEPPPLGKPTFPTTMTY